MHLVGIFEALRLEYMMSTCGLALLTIGDDVFLWPTNHTSPIDFVVSFLPICHDYL
jgi:hypothetical protein